MNEDISYIPILTSVTVILLFTVPFVVLDIVKKNKDRFQRMFLSKRK